MEMLVTKFVAMFILALATQAAFGLGVLGFIATRNPEELQQKALNSTNKVEKRAASRLLQLQQKEQTQMAIQFFATFLQCPWQQKIEIAIYFVPAFIGAICQQVFKNKNEFVATVMMATGFMFIF